MINMLKPLHQSYNIVPGRYEMFLHYRIILGNYFSKVRFKLLTESLFVTTIKYSEGHFLSSTGNEGGVRLTKPKNLIGLFKPSGGKLK